MTLRVFLSATFADLRDERLEVIEVFRRLRAVEKLDVDLVTMEDFGFSTSPPLEKCLEMLQTADAYLGIIGHRYGSMPPGGSLSYTEREYRLAHKRRIPIYILERAGRVDSSQLEDDPDKFRKLKRLKEHAKKQHLVLRFDSTDELGKALVQFLPQQLTTAFPATFVEMDAQLELVPHFRLRDQLTRMTTVLKSPKTLHVLAISAIGLLRDRALLENYIRQGCEIRILVMKRGGLAARLIAENAERTSVEDDLFQVEKRATYIKTLIEKHKSGSFALRALDLVPSATIYLLDANLRTAVGWVGTYTPDLSSPATDKWLVELSRTRGDAALTFYLAQFERLWAKAIPLA